MVFSWTWNENRKNDIDDVKSANGKRGSVGITTGELSLSSGVGRAVVMPPRISPTTLGKKPRAVSPVDSFTRASRAIQFFHLKTTLEAHQKLATLSSKRPLLNGKILVMGSSTEDIGAKGGRKGRNRIRNVSTVTRPRRMKRRPLFEHEQCNGYSE